MKGDLVSEDSHGQCLPAIWTSLWLQLMPKLAVVPPSRYDSVTPTMHLGPRNPPSVTPILRNVIDQVDHSHGSPSVIYPAGGPPTLLFPMRTPGPGPPLPEDTSVIQPSTIAVRIGHAVGRLHSLGCCGGPPRIRNNGVDHPDTKLEAGHLESISDVLEDGLVLARGICILYEPRQRTLS